MKYASFWRRAAAWSVDAIIYTIAFYSSKLILTDYFIHYAANILLAVAYYITFLSSKIQATPGKYLLKIFAVKKQSFEKLSFLRTSGRFLADVSPAIPVIIITMSYDFDKIFSDLKSLQNPKIVFQDPFLLEQIGTPLIYSFTTYLFALIVATIFIVPVLFTKEKTTIYDMIAGTRIVCGRALENKQP